MKHIGLTLETHNDGSDLCTSLPSADPDDPRVYARVEISLLGGDYYRFDSFLSSLEGLDPASSGFEFPIIDLHNPQSPETLFTQPLTLDYKVVNQISIQ